LINFVDRLDFFRAADDLTKFSPLPLRFLFFHLLTHTAGHSTRRASRSIVEPEFR